ncbi:hypothetical protein [Myroides pelagicus]|uniref:Uncharacterized protein n=1 Tax=Myroides pelagicus TaxID=270914 RepID=A0A7K1GLT7_9FLAO|nr:hypothetical protein [Myroides pelagicus]MEC4112706.1 hypothetical protein [Myroides pelagicus]MTH29700.1 hypothetical protein [Myroides pelagicus]
MSRLSHKSKFLVGLVLFCSVLVFSCKKSNDTSEVQEQEKGTAAKDPIDAYLDKLETLVDNQLALYAEVMESKEGSARKYETLTQEISRYIGDGYGLTLKDYTDEQKVRLVKIQEKYRVVLGVKDSIK